MKVLGVIVSCKKDIEPEETMILYLHDLFD